MNLKLFFIHIMQKVYKVVNENTKIKSQFGKGLKIVFAGNIKVAQSFDTIFDGQNITTKLEDFKFIIIGDKR